MPIPTRLDDDPSLPTLDPSSSSRVLGIGVTGAIYALDPDTVAKLAPLSDSPFADNQALEDIRVERRIYERLGAHPRICGYVRAVNRGLVLERLGGSVREYLVRLRGRDDGRRRGDSGSKRGDQRPSREQALKWSIQVTEAIAYVHSKGVVQGDVGCYNFLLDRDGGDDLKLCDFGGSSLDGCALRVGYGVRSRALWKAVEEEDDSPSVACELFALGSALFEMWTGQQPYEELPDEDVERRYGRLEFPELEGLVPPGIAEVIRKCWLGKYASADLILEELQMFAMESMSLQRGSDNNSHALPSYRPTLPTLTALFVLATTVMICASIFARSRN